MSMYTDFPCPFPPRRLLHALACLCAACCMACGGARAGDTPADTRAASAPLASLPGPAAVRTASAAPPCWQALGEDCLAPGQQLATPAGDGALLLEPNWSLILRSGEIASAVFLLNAQGLATDGAVHLEWSQTRQPGALWLGLADFSAGRWEWFNGEQGLAQLALEPRHCESGGDVALAVVCLGEASWRLDRVHLGASLPSPHDVITAGCSEISGGMLPSRADRRKNYLEPVCWAGPVATGGDKLGLQGTLPVPGWAGCFGAGRASVWCGHGSFWASASDGQLDNNRVRQQWLSWLLGGGKRLGFSRTHGEGESAATLDAGILGPWLSAQGVDFDDINQPLTDEVLAGYDALFIGNSWDDMPENEQTAVVDFVRGGGGLIVLSLGWAYYSYNDDPQGDDVLVNQLGRVFGWWSMPGIINDPDAPNGLPSQPSYAIHPLGEFTPARVVVLKDGVDDIDSVKLLAASAPGDIYIIEGQYTGLQLPTAKWAELHDPSGALDIMEQMFATEMQLAGGATPYGAEPTWFISKYDPDGAYWMHSGNPIVYKQEAAGEVLGAFNDEGECGWGFAHENGHNMVIDACGNLFVHSGTAEPWCNVFNVYAREQLGWPERSGSYDAGWAYHAQASPSFSELTSDAWILLGCLQLVWDKYGWDGMQAFFTQAGADHGSGMNAGDDAARTAYFVEQLSHAYQLDFAPLLTHWGFPVTDTSRAITDVYPDADIPW